MQNYDTGDEDHAFEHASWLVGLSALPMTLKAAIELGLLRGISDAGPLSCDELADRLGLLATNPRAAAMIDRILRLLSSYSILSISRSPDSDERIIPRYAAAPVCKYLTPDENGVSMAPFALMLQDKILMLQDKILMEIWHHIKDAVIKGTRPFDMVYGTNLFDYCGKDSRFNALFNEAMKGHSSIVLKKVLDAYQGFHDAKVVVDVGGGLGSALSMIISRHNHIKGINFDLPHVVSHAPTIPSVEHVGGDMFEVIPSGDVIFMKWILHDWSDECCVKILANCQKALPVYGKVVIVECILPETPEQTPAAQIVFQIDMAMLAHNPGGQERTENEFKVLATQSGFSEFKTLYINSNTCVIELSNK